jgi:hypothetical protein
MKGDTIAIMEILTRIERVIKMTNNMILEYPMNPMFEIVLRNLEVLKIEFSQPNPNKEKINKLHYGFIRSYEEVAAYENTPFGEEVGILLIELNNASG